MYTYNLYSDICMYDQLGYAYLLLQGLLGISSRAQIEPLAGTEPHISIPIIGQQWNLQRAKRSKQVKVRTIDLMHNYVFLVKRFNDMVSTR